MYAGTTMVKQLQSKWSEKNQCTALGSVCSERFFFHFWTQKESVHTANSYAKYHDQVPDFIT